MALDFDSMVPGVLYVFDPRVAGSIRPATDAEAADVAAAIAAGE